ncbi:CaiB/BaiF CoA transferase family protein [Desertimonas flava]|uniref:CaiB/BaiF CoA transferase family protein n=1 Tax=Desertimonas flava TaxID=2064846 RepID=UPI000E345CDE|nr:CoA transferase [Desertimonas flava]
MPGPLEGIKVVELGVWVAAPAAGGILADWGADVVKIEPPEGDPSRLFQQMLGGDMPTNPVFEMDNRGKRGVILDLSTGEDLAIALELLDEADVFVTNVRTAALARLGLDDQTLLARNPRLVYGHITGYGRYGADADQAAFDIAAFWSRAGIAHLLTPEGGELPFQRGGMGDHNTGLALAGGISAALYSRERTGEGQLVTTSLYREGVYTISFDLNMVLGWGQHPAIGERSRMPSPTANNYTAGDGKRFWIVGLVGDRHWPPLARVVGHPEWIDDERFATAMARAENAVELRELLDEEFARRPLAEWREIFAGEPDMFWAPVQDPYEVVNDPVLRDIGGIVDVPDGPGVTPMIATPVDFGATPWSPRGLAPALGEHTDDIVTPRRR